MVKKIKENIKKNPIVSEKRLKRLIEKEKERKTLEKYQTALSLWAEYIEERDEKIVITLDGRDTAGKGNDIRKVTKYLNPNIFDIKAFGIPNEHEKKGFNWFRRYVKFFPKEKNLRIFDRSWYNRASVEPVMGFCTEKEYDWFLERVNDFEKKYITDKGYKFLKIYLSVTKQTQKKRLKVRESIKERWKLSFVDRNAQKKWESYILAKQKILEHTHTPHAPWLIIDSNRRYLSAIEIIKAIIGTSDELKTRIESELKINLSQNQKITRSGAQELEKMKKLGQIPTKISTFDFKQD